ncbi:MAG: hypothetical protein QOK31_1409, partial [Solirubrobacteraceae bacterium]|nr:hypothetical protein [Solirubrobacteraceae bacterium]
APLSASLAERPSGNLRSALNFRSQPGDTGPEPPMDGRP